MVMKIRGGGKVTKERLKKNFARNFFGISTFTNSETHLLETTISTENFLSKKVENVSMLKIASPLKYIYFFTLEKNIFLGTLGSSRSDRNRKYLFVTDDTKNGL